MLRRVPIGWAAAGILLAACGGGGDEPAPPLFSPTATIVFPGAGLVAAGSLIVRGRATSRPEAPIVAMSVNGTAATSPDGFSSWQAVIDLTTGIHVLDVKAREGAGSWVPVANLTVRAGLLPSSVGRHAGLLPGGDVVFLEAEDIPGPSFLPLGRVLRAHLDSGTVSLVSGSNRGTGPPIDNAKVITVLPDGDIAVGIEPHPLVAPVHSDSGTGTVGTSL